jgi:hypothetical protein
VPDNQPTPLVERLERAVRFWKRFALAAGFALVVTCCATAVVVLQANATIEGERQQTAEARKVADQRLVEKRDAEEVVRRLREQARESLRLAIASGRQQMPRFEESKEPSLRRFRDEFKRQLDEAEASLKTRE